jgi:hypothetical protein
MWSILGSSTLTYETNRCSVLSFFGKWFTSTLGTSASSSATTHVVRARWGITSFSPHCQTRLSANSGHDEESQSTGLHDLLTLILWSFGCEDISINALVYSAPINGKVLQQKVENVCQSFEGNQEFRQSACLCTMKRLRFCWNAWEPHGASAAYITLR